MCDGLAPGTEMSVLMGALCTCYSHSEVDTSLRSPTEPSLAFFRALLKRCFVVGPSLAALLQIAASTAIPQYPSLPSAVFFSVSQITLDITYVPLAYYLLPLRGMYMQFS